MDWPLFKRVVYIEESHEEPMDEIDYRCIQCGSPIDGDSYPYCPSCWDNLEDEGYFE